MIVTSIENSCQFIDLIRKVYDESQYSYEGLKKIWELLEEEDDSNCCESYMVIEPFIINEEWTEYGSVEEIDKKYENIKDVQKDYDAYELKNGNILVRNY